MSIAPVHLAAKNGEPRRLGLALGFALLMAYALRASILTSVVSGNAVELMSSAFAGALALSSFYVLAGGAATASKTALLLLLATGASLIRCEQPYFSILRWTGWALMISCVGPVIFSSAARDFRFGLMRCTLGLLVVATLGSAVYWLIGMPNLGRGDFSGLTNHSMILGPIAGFVGVVSFVKAFAGGRLIWMPLYPVAMAVGLLASSRSAIAAMVFGTLIAITVRIKKHTLLASIVILSTMMACVAPATTLELLISVVPTQLTSGLAKKSWNNSREYHWEARWDEFLSSPLTGVGFATGWEDSAGFDEDSGNVETGSSYLSVLSMTGLVGVAACLFLAGGLAHRLRSSWPRLSEPRRVEHCALAGFWIVHLGAQGYIYAVGSMIGILFWLWVGCLDTELRELSLRSATAPHRLERVRMPANGPGLATRAVANGSRRRR